MPSPVENDQNGLTLAWGWLSLILCIIAISALGTLAVIAKKQGADTLSTIALALAILSFAAQLIVALAQAYNGNLQIAQVDRVNADTRSSLAEIRATSNALLSNQREQFSEVLRAALKAAVPAAVEDVAARDDRRLDGSSEVGQASKDLEERLLVRVNEALASSQSSSRPTDIPPTARPSELDNRIHTYPDEKKGKELLRVLNSLSPRTAAVLSRNADGIGDLANKGLEPYGILDGTPRKSLRDLQDRGLVTITDMEPSSSGESRYKIELTDLGVGVASLMLGTGRTPDWLLEAQ